MVSQNQWPPQLIFNMDESFVHVNGGGRAEVVISSASTPVVLRQTRESAQHITIAPVSIFSSLFLFFIYLSHPFSF